MASSRLSSWFSSRSKEAAQADDTASVASDASTPATPDAAADVKAAAALAASSRKYWPTDDEVEAARALLSGEDAQECNAAMANRFLRATGGDCKHAVARIKDTLAWRRAERPEEMVCTACREDHKSHYMQVVGHDMSGRPLIYSCLALATNRDVEDNRKHMISTFEQAIRLMPSHAATAAAAASSAAEAPAADTAAPAAADAAAPADAAAAEAASPPASPPASCSGASDAGGGTPHVADSAADSSFSGAPSLGLPTSGRPVESWCWLMDFHGFSIRDCDPRLAKIFLNVSAAHYPERLGTFFIVSAPTVFNTLWRAISRFIDPVTKQKIHFVHFSRKGDNSKLEALLRRYFDAATTAWLLREMGDNRDKSLALSKAYSYPDLSRLAAEGRGAPDVVAAQSARQEASSCRGHDHLGSPAFMEQLAGKPDLLLPHLQALSLSSSEL